MEHLTKTKHGYALYIHVGDKDANAVNSAIEVGAAAFGGNKSEFVRACVVSGVQEPVAQGKVEHALQIARREGAVEIIKALEGWPIINVLEFASEDSLEYKAWLSSNEEE